MTKKRGIKEIKETLRALSQCHGISGYEEQVASTIKEMVEDLVDSIEIDHMGNLVCTVKGNKPGPRILLSAHMDEIGFVVRYVEDKYIWLTPIGGISTKHLPFTRVIVHTEKGRYRGVIASTPPFFEHDERRKKIYEMKDLYLDIGMIEEEDKQKDKKKDKKSGDEDWAKRLGIKPGDMVTFDASFVELYGDRVMGKSFDDRAGCTTLVHIIERLGRDFSGTAYFLFCVQEEVGLKGSRTAAYRIDPDVALVFDTTSTGDVPGASKNDSTTTLGKGPVITLVDAEGRGLITPKIVRKWLVETAEKNKIRHQIEVGLDFGTTDATIISLTREGVPTGLLSIPSRNVHTPCEILSLGDLEDTIRLGVEAVKSASKYFSPKKRD